jgi:hypothetical protein
MSLLAIEWTRTGIRLGCRPDPQRPPIRLDEAVPALLASAPSPGGGATHGNLGTDLAQAFEAFLEPNGADRDAQTAAELTLQLRRLLEAIHLSDEATILILGEVSRVGLVLPPNVPVSRQRSMSTLLSQAAVDVTAVPRAAATLAGIHGAYPHHLTYLRIRWNEDLECDLMASGTSPNELGRAAPGKRLRGVGITEWIRILAHQLAKQHKLPMAEALWSAHACIDPSSAGPRPAAEGLAPALPEEAAAAWESLRPRAEAFLRQAIVSAASAGARSLVVESVSPGLARGRVLLKRMFSNGEIPFHQNTTGDEALFGLFALLPTPAILPYDCGVLLRIKGEEQGIGTLVLVSPAFVGTEAESEPLKMRTQEGQSLEIAFYTRRIDHESGQVTAQVMKSHIFNPRTDAKGGASVSVRMRVDESSAGEAVITAVINDRNAGDSIRFERLPFVTDSALTEPPYRSVEALAAMGWTDRIRNIRTKEGSCGDWSVERWRSAFEGTSGPISRANYAGMIMRAVLECLGALETATAKSFQEVAKGIPGTLQKDEWVSSAAPEQMHRAMREALFGALRNSVREAAELGGSNCRSWLNAQGSTDPESPNEPAVRAGINALTQDLSRHPKWEPVVAAAAELPPLYHHACSPPDSLNIDW